MQQNKAIRFIGIDQVSNLVELGRTSIYTIPDFPRPIKIGGAGATAQGGSRWVESEIIDWMRSRIELRNTSPAPVHAARPRLGRPSSTEREEAMNRDITVKKLRAQRAISGLESK